MPQSQLDPQHEDHPAVISRNARRGLGLFLIYFALYLGFLALNVFFPADMARTAIPLGPESDAQREISLHGPNLAVFSGIFLILAAIFLSLVYMRLTRPRAA